MAMGVFGAFRGLDAFGKTVEDIKVKTRTGALLTLASALFIFTFTFIEYFDYRRLHVDTAMVVDRSRGEKLTVSFNITFPRVPCYLLNLDIVDISGNIQRDIYHHIMKVRLDPSSLQPIHDGRYMLELENELDRMVESKKENWCGSCYGGLEPVSGCCQTCDDVRKAYADRGWAFGNPDQIDQCVKEHWTERVQAQAKEGCNISGRAHINKVNGNLQFSPGRSFVESKDEVYEMVPYLKDANHYFGHFIHHFEIQSERETFWTRRATPPHIAEWIGTEKSPLDEIYAHTEDSNYMFQYFLKVVSTKYKELEGHTWDTFQYSVTSYERDLATKSHGKNAEGLEIIHERKGIPGAFFNLEISPMQVYHFESRQSFAHFITSLVAIIGGVLTVATLMDTVLFNTGHLIKKGQQAVAADGKRAYGVAPAVKIL